MPQGDATLTVNENTVFSSIDDLQNAKSNQASRYAVERKPEKILVMNSVDLNN